MGLYKRKGSQFYWMTYRVNGKKRYESTGTANKKFAHKIFAKRTTEITEGKWFKKETTADITVGSMIDKYMSEVSIHLKKSTHERNAQLAQHLTAFFSNMHLKDASTSEISRYKSEMMKQGKSTDSLRRELGLLRRAFNVAIEEWEFCKDNPVPKVLKTLGKEDSKRVRFLSPEESQRLMLALPAWLRPMVILARHTGLRRGNLVALAWEHIDFERAVIMIPETKNSDPIGIPLTKTAQKTLKDLQAVRYLHSPYVFCDNDGKPHSKNRVSVAFKRACKRGNVDNFRFHDLRHDFASMLVQSGVPIQVVKELLGHKDLRMTMRYAHLAPENLRSAVNVLEENEKRLQYGYSG